MFNDCKLTQWHYLLLSLWFCLHCKELYQYDYPASFVKGSLEIMGNNVPVNHMTMDVDIPRLLFKLYSKNHTKEEISNDVEIMENYFGSKQTGLRIMNSLSDKEWYELADSVSTQDD